MFLLRRKNQTFINIVIYWPQLYISILRRKYTQPDCTQNAGSDPCYASVRCLIEIKSGNLRNHGQEWQVSDMDSFCSHWFYWKEMWLKSKHYSLSGLRFHNHAHSKSEKKRMVNGDDKGKYGPQWF